MSGRFSPSLWAPGREGEGEGESSCVDSCVGFEGVSGFVRAWVGL